MLRTNMLLWPAPRELLLTVTLNPTLTLNPSLQFPTLPPPPSASFLRLHFGGTGSEAIFLGTRQQAQAGEPQYQRPALGHAHCWMSVQSGLGAHTAHGHDSTMALTTRQSPPYILIQPLHCNLPVLIWAALLCHLQQSQVIHTYRGIPLTPPINSGPRHLLRGETHPVPLVMPLWPRKGCSSTGSQAQHIHPHARTAVGKQWAGRGTVPTMGALRAPHWEQDVLPVMQQAAVHHGKCLCRWSFIPDNHHQTVVGVSFI